MEDLRIEAPAEAGLGSRGVRQSVSEMVCDPALGLGDALFQLVDREMIGPGGAQRAQLGTQRILPVTEILPPGKLVGGNSAQLVLYPGEGHGNRKAGARLDYNLRTLRWMQHYLQGEGGDMPDYQLDYEEVLDFEEVGTSAGI